MAGAAARMETLLWVAQRASAAVLAVCVAVHLATVIYAVRGGLTAGEILARTHGSAGWLAFYSIFVLAVARQARFGELQRMLGGISSRTLSDKLQTLRDEGLVERQVFDEQPVRIEYHLTKEGVTTAALATPLFAHLNHRKM